MKSERHQNKTLRTISIVLSAISLVFFTAYGLIRWILGIDISLIGNLGYICTSLAVTAWVVDLRARNSS